MMMHDQKCQSSQRPIILFENITKIESLELNQTPTFFSPFLCVLQLPSFTLRTRKMHIKLYLSLEKFYLQSDFIYWFTFFFIRKLSFWRNTIRILLSEIRCEDLATLSQIQTKRKLFEINFKWFDFNIFSYEIA